jgi:hypothetical protein
MHYCVGVFQPAIGAAQSINSLAVVGEIDLGKRQRRVSWCRKIEYFHIKAILDEIEHNPFSGLTATAGYEYLLHLFLQDIYL